MRKVFLQVAGLMSVAGVMWFVSCEDPGVPSSESGETQTFPVRGVVQQRMDDPRTILIDHEEIPGFMPRMIMPFRVLDPAEFDGLEPGMEVTLQFHVRDDESWATDVEATGKTGAITIETETDDSSRLLSEGDVLPDYGFVDEKGEPIRLSDFRGMPVALTFVFSRCPVPEYCPRMMDHFAAVRDRLESDPDGPERYRLLTISFDSENDTPEVMRNWGAAFGHEAGQPWNLLSTPDATVVDRISSNVGLRFSEANGTLQHNLRTLVLDGDGVIRALYTDETWTVDEMVDQLKRAGSPKM